MRFGPPVVEAALRAGIHYLDTSGEQHWVLKLRDEFGNEFAKAGLALIPSTACMYGLSEIGARYHGDWLRNWRAFSSFRQARFR